MNECKNLLGDKMQELDNSSSDEDDGDNRAVAKAKKSWSRAKNFFQSFADKASDLWEVISGPYTKATEQDMEDFIDDEEDEDADDDFRGHQIFDRKKAMSQMREEKALAEYYERRAGEGDESASDDHEEKKGGDISDNDDDDFCEQQPASASEDDENDEWVRNIRNKQRKGSLGRKNGGASQRQQSFKKAGEKRYESASEDPDYDDPMSLPKATPITKKKAIKAVFEDSDDE